MKTAISVPDELFEVGEATALKLSMSRSQLYATALAEFLARREKQSITEELNAFYSASSSELDPILKEIQFSSIEPDKW